MKRFTSTEATHFSIHQIRHSKMQHIAPKEHFLKFIANMPCSRQVLQFLYLRVGFKPYKVTLHTDLVTAF